MDTYQFRRFMCLGKYLISIGLYRKGALSGRKVSQSNRDYRSPSRLSLWSFSTIVLLSFLLPPAIPAQTFLEAPAADRKVKKITEWHRTDLKAEGKAANTSVYDKKGKLIHYYPTGTPKEQWNNYEYDRRNHLVAKREFFEGTKHQTNCVYPNGQKVCESTFHDKTYRICWYYRGKKLVEKKEFAKGGEMGKNFQVLKRTQYFYNKRQQLKSEKISVYAIQGRYKGQVVGVEKILHFYDPAHHQEIHCQFFNLDKSLRMERFFSYDRQNKLTQTIDYYPLEKRVDTVELKYKEGRLWQKIEERENQKNILVYVKGRPIRLRSYLDGNLVGVVDYAYEYY